MIAWLPLLWAALLASPAVSPAVSGEGESLYTLLARLEDPGRATRREARDRLVARRDPAALAPLVDTLFFVPVVRRAETFDALRTLAGVDRGSRHLDWVEWIGAQDLPTPAGYLEWKGTQLARIDRRYAAVFYRGAPTRIRPEEIVFGGVGVDGIPAWDDPEAVPAVRADFMRPADRVFGVTLGGESRAYPHSVLSWHEMVNDSLGGRPFALTYCTLCGTAILYDTRTPRAESPYRFGTSGLLYRSNKLMFDRQSWTLWSQIDGEPVLGRLARSAIRLPILPLSMTTWSDWKKRQPGTTVARPDPAIGRRYGYDYREGAADRARRGVSFPIWRRSDRLAPEAEVFALRLAGVAKVYPVDRLPEVLLDRIAEIDIVLLHEPRTGSIAAYERGGLRLRRAAGDADALIDDRGRRWTVDEEALTAEGETALRRLPGHRAFWAGWYGLHPESLVWDGQ